MKKFDGNQLPPCSRAERKDQANQVYNWGLAFISISVTARSIAYWLWVDYTVPKVLNQMVRWTTIASIYWCNSGLKRVWSRRYWQRWGILTIKLYVNKIGEKNFFVKSDKISKFGKLEISKICHLYTTKNFFLLEILLLCLVNLNVVYIKIVMNTHSHRYCRGGTTES